MAWLIMLTLLLVISHNSEVCSQTSCASPEMCIAFPDIVCPNGGTCSSDIHNCTICIGSTGPTSPPVSTTQSSWENTTVTSVERGVTTFSPDKTCYKKPVCRDSTNCNPNGRLNCTSGWGVTATGCCTRCDLDCGFGACFIINEEPDFEPYAECHCSPRYDHVKDKDPCVDECEVDPDKARCITPKNYVPIIAASVIGAVVFLLAIFGITLWFFYRKRMTWALKLVYYMSSYEDNDELDYDAFISYKSDGIGDSFVTQLLYKKLEDDFGYSCVFHARNFVPGKMIIDNILEAINNSRRVILVLTKDYLSSEWCHLEVSVAQQRMMERKTRILPLMLEDITEELGEYPNLKLV